MGQHEGGPVNNESPPIHVGDDQDGSTKKGSDSQSARLYKAIEKGDFKQVDEILKSGHMLEVQMEHKFKDVSDEAPTHITPLALSVVLNQTALVELLLMRGASLKSEIADTGSTNLHLACGYGSTASVSLLLSEGAEINRPDRKGATPLRIAVLNGRVEIVSRLLDANATMQDDEFQSTIFQTAAMNGQLEVAKLLLRRGPRSQVEDVNSLGNAALHLACLNGHVDLAKWLLSLKVPVEARGGEKSTPLHFACMGGFENVVQMLLEAGADVHRTNAYDNTAFLLACLYAHPQLIGVLRRFGALTSAVDKNRSSCFHHLVNSLKEFSDAHRTLFGELKGMGEDIDQPNVFGYTPLFIACRDRKTGHVRALLDLGADVNAIAPMGASPLMEASCKADHKDIIDLLLNRHADVTIANKHGLTALGLACRFGRLQHAQILLHHNSKATHQDIAGHTPLFAAVDHEHVEVAFEMVKTAEYYPINPLRTKAFTESPSDGERAGCVFLKHFQRIVDNAPDGIEPLIYWAISNGQLALLTKCLQHEPKAIRFKRSGATWLHIAAMHGQGAGMVELLSGAGTFEKAGSEITALHLAASNGTLITTQSLLDLVSKESSVEGRRARIAAIIEVNKRDESALSLAISEKHKEVENFFWTEIRESGAAELDYARLFPAEAKEVLEVLAEWEKPGREWVLEHLLRQWFPAPSNVVITKWTTLHWAVHHSQAIAVWWLLSKGGYSLGTAIESAKAQVQKSPVGELIQELLQRPPPILDHVGNPDDDFPPQSPEVRDPDNQSLDLKGIVVDVLSDGKRIRTPYADPQIRAMIYGQGPDALMKEARNLDERHLDVLKGRLRRLEKASISTPATVQPPIEHVPRVSGLALPEQEAQQQVKPSLGGTRTDLRLRWISLPVNDLQLLRDLVTRLSHESGRSQWDHRTLMTFLNRSWAQLSAGGGRNYMKPQCMRVQMVHGGNQNNQSNQSPGAEGNGWCTALYVPFLTLGKHDPRKARQKSAEDEAFVRQKGSKNLPNGPRNPSNSQDVRQVHRENTIGQFALSLLLNSRNEDDGLDESTNSRNVRPIVHEPMTLDQYYYPTIFNTNDRDNDQVISKYIIKQNRSKTKQYPDQDSDNRSSIDANEKLREEDSVKTILMVDQLWIWIIDDKTIVTSMTERSDQPLNSRLLHRVLDTIINGESQGRFERPNSAHSVMELILGVATGFFMQKFVRIDQEIMKGPMEIFRESIRDVADKEIKLFNQFLNVLDEETRNRNARTEHQQSTFAREAPKNPHHIIAKETRFLDQIRDIRDELHMLRSLAEDQEFVWKQAFATTQLRSCLQYNHPCTPTDVKSDLDDMIREADTVQNSVNTLLDLRQKQASLVEAESGRLQANDTARQSNSVFVFTLITIVFLPLSFLSSIFALDISDFPHDSGGDVKYEGWWLFPILFGVSAIVSIPAILFAWNVNAVQEWLRLRHRRSFNRKPENVVARGFRDSHDDQIDSVRRFAEEQRNNRTREREEFVGQDVPRRSWSSQEGVYSSSV